MALRAVRNFWYEGLKTTGMVWTEPDLVAAQSLMQSGNCVNNAWQPVIKPWVVVAPKGPMRPAGP
jgi:hypothetical protein